jgi:putative ABC transport system ATP-binding protein
MSSSHEAKSLVNIRNVTKTFRRGSEDIHVLSGLNLDIREGEFLALMGPSGSGKSTLLNLIGGLDRPTSGSVEIGGDRIETLSDRQLAAWRARHVGFVFQFYNLLPVLTAERNVELPLLLTHLSKSQRKEHVKVALDVVGLSHRVGSASPAASSPTRRFCFATNRPATSTANPATKSSACCNR